MLAGDALHALPEIVDVLNVDGGNDGDARVEQFVDVFPAAGVLGSRRVVVSQSVHQAGARMALENRRHIHHANAIHVAERNYFQLAQDGRAFRRSLGLDGAHHHVLAAFFAPPPFVQHAIGFAHPGCVAQEYFQAASALVILFRLNLLEQLLWAAASCGARHGVTSIITVYCGSAPRSLSWRGRMVKAITRRYERWIRAREEALCFAATNRVVRDFEWGLDWTRDWPSARLHPKNGDAPEDYIAHLNRLTMLGSDEFYGYERPSDF